MSNELVTVANSFEIEVSKPKYTRNDHIAMAESNVRQMVSNIENGEVIADVIHPSGDRIVVTRTANGNYGYRVFEGSSEKPNYYAESPMLIENLTGMTDSTGRNITYPLAKTFINESLVGPFCEYINEPETNTRAFYVFFKQAPNAEVELSQRIAGFDHSRPTCVYSVDLYREKVNVAGDAQILDYGDKKEIRVGMSGLKQDGSLDFDTVYKKLLEAEAAKEAIDGESMNPEELMGAFKNYSENAQMLFYDIYQGYGLPLFPAVEQRMIEPGTRENINKVLAGNSSALKELESSEAKAKSK